MDWHVALGVLAGAFGLFVLYAFRPSFGGGGGGAGRAALKAALAKAEVPNASDREKALAFAEAGELAARIGRSSVAVLHFAQAARLDASSTTLLDRASTALAKRPRALETLCWRLLASAAWTKEARPATRATLERLAALYEGARKKPIHARALRHALKALEPPL